MFRTSDYLIFSSLWILSGFCNEYWPFCKLAIHGYTLATSMNSSDIRISRPNHNLCQALLVIALIKLCLHRQLCLHRPLALGTSACICPNKMSSQALFTLPLTPYSWANNYYERFMYCSSGTPSPTQVTKHSPPAPMELLVLFTLSQLSCKHHIIVVLYLLFTKCLRLIPVVWSGMTFVSQLPIGDYFIKQVRTSWTLRDLTNPLQCSRRWILFSNLSIFEPHTHLRPSAMLLRLSNSEWNLSTHL